MLKRFIDWAFICGDWRIAYRKRNIGNFYDHPFVIIPNTKQYWFADPLLFEDGDKTFLFVEAFNRKTYKGDIGFFTIEDDGVSEFELLIENNFHMSYPLVFKHDGNYYMIPESEENGTVDLYEAKSFPHEWVRVKSLLCGVHYADTTLLEYDGNKYLFTYHPADGKWELIIFNFDMDKLEVNHFQTICYSENVCRPAGKFYKDEHDRIVRPVQNCKEGYGKGTLLYEVKMVDGKFVEKQIYEYDNSLFLIQNQKSVDNFHTYSLTNKYEVVDFIWKRFDLLKKIKWQIRKYKRYKRHSK